MTDEEILKLWVEAGIIDSDAMWPFTRTTLQERAKRKKDEQDKLLTNTEEALL
jgi:hypothetical protein